MLDQSRLEATNAPANQNRPRRRPLGATFWKLFTAFLFFGPALAVFLLGYLIFNAVADDDKPAAPSIQAPAEEAAPSPPAAIESPAEEPPASGRVQPDGDVIYQDEAGTWLNTKRGPEPVPLIVPAEARSAEGDAPLKGGPVAESGAGQAPNLLTLGLNLLTGGTGRNWSEPAPAPARIAKADQFYQDDNGVWRNTGAGVQVLTQSEHIYQDEDGVWRNLSQSTGPDSASPAPVADNPMAALMSGLASQGGETGGQAPMDLLGGLLGGAAGNGGDLGGLMGALMGGGGQSGSGDLGGLMGALMGGGGQSGSGDLGGLVGSLMGGGSQGGGGDLGGLVGALMGGGQGGGDLSGLMGALTGGGQGGGDLSDLMNGLMSSTVPPGSGAANAPAGETAPLNVIRAQPRSFDSSSALSPASQITTNATGLNLEGYERFDPAKSGPIKSDWEYFNDPR